MPEIFSYLQHPMLSCLRRIPQIFMEIDKVLIIYFNNEKKIVEARFLTKDDSYSSFFELNISDTKSYINNMRLTTQPTAWFAQDELEFEIRIEKNRQLKLKSEDNKTILRLAFENETDKRSDLIFIYFNSLLNIIPVSSSKKKITPEDKSIIQNIVYRSLKIFVNNERENKVFFDNVSKTTQNLLNENEKLKKKIIVVNERYGQTLLSQCYGYLRKIENSNSDMPKFEFSEESIAKIKNYNGRSDELERIVVNAAWASANFFFNKEENIIIIHDSMLIFDKTAEKISGELKETGFDEVDSKKYYNIIFMLNKYEEAAQLALKAGEKINLKNVGKYCKPHDCTGAAVSDFINKYIDDINTLYNKYPDKWQTVRKYLKSISSKIVVYSDFKKIKNA